AVKQDVIAGVSQGIGGGSAPAGTKGSPLSGEISSLVTRSVARASRPAVAFAGGVVTLGALISLLVPNIPADRDPSDMAAAAGPPESDPDPTPEPDPVPA
ncbi:MAG TPA: hypothetical protein VGM93_00790, partial [Acidimicrobiales bacterium]